MSLRRNVSLILAVALLSATATAPALAKPNNGAYQRSAEAFKKQLYDEYCAGVKGDLDKAEAEADKVAGTKAAKKWADAADNAWKMGHDAGCPWAA